MIKLKTLLYTILLIVSIGFTKNTMAQSPLNFPSTTSLVASGNQTLSSVSLPDTSNWFKWKVDSAVISINLKMLTTTGKYGIKKAKLYLRTNGHLENLIQEELSPFDSTIFIFAQHLNPNDSIFLNVTTDVQCSGCGSTPPTAKITFVLMPQGCTGYTQPSCELVKDGAMEYFNLNCSQLRTGFPWAPCFWYVPNSVTMPGTSDYFNGCAPNPVPGGTGLGNVANSTANAFSQGLAGLSPHAGSAYLGTYNFISGVATDPLVAAHYREYITNKLATPMVAGKTYIVSMYVRLSNVSRYASSNIQVLFTNNFIVQPQVVYPQPLPNSPVYINAEVPTTGGQLISSFTGSTPVTNKTGWTLLTTTITANSNYTHLSIGNFQPNSGTQVTDLNQAGWITQSIVQASMYPGSTKFADCAYYYYDDVSVRPIDLKVNPDKSICTPSTTVLTSTISCVPAGGTVTYTWAPSASLSTPNAGTTNASPSVTTNYTLTATVTFTNTNGTVSVIILMDDVTVTVTNSGTFTLSASANANPICLYAGASTTLTTNAGTNLSYTWTSGAATYTVPNPVVSPTVTTTYTVTTINCGQTMTAAVTVTVDPPPIFYFTPNTICSETAVSVTTPTNTTITYIDFGEPGALNNVVNPHIYLANGNYSITVDATTIGSCTSHTVIPITVVTLTTSSISYTQQPCSYTYTISQIFNCTNITDSSAFEIFAATNPTLNIYTYTNTLIVGGTFTFTFPGPGTYTITSYSTADNWSPVITLTVPAVSPPTVSITASPSNTICLGSSVVLTGSGASTYTWSTSQTTSTISVTPTVTTTYTLTGSTGPGCVDTETITVHVTPNPTVTASASPTAICSGFSSTLTANGATTYTWMPGAITTASTVVSPTTTTIYTVTGKTGLCSNTKTVQVIVNPMPTVNITGNPSICKGVTVVLTGSGASTYTWAPCASSCTTTVKAFTPTVTTIYTLTGTSANGCVGSKTFTVTVVPIPTVTVNSATICAGSCATLTANGANTYTWSAPISSTVNPAVVCPTVSTIYTVTGRNTGCATTSIKTSTVTVIPALPGVLTISTSVGSPVVNNGTGTNTIVLSSSITNTTGLTFNWSNGATTPTTNFNLTQPEIIKLTVNNNACGTSLTQSICMNYVAAACGNTYTPLNNATLTGTATLGATTATYLVTGTLTINWPTLGNALENKTFLMTTGSKVEISPTTNMIINNVRFFSCGDMWKGIEVISNSTNSARVTLSGEATSIEDAHMGFYHIHSGSNPLPIVTFQDFVVFNKNYYDVYLDGTTSPTNVFPLTVINNRWLSQSSNTSPGGNLKCSGYYAPTVKARSYAGLYAINAGIVTFSVNVPSASFYNVLKNKDYGLYLNNTNSTVNNVSFCDAIGVANSYSLNFAPLPVGVGIYSKNSGYINVKPTNTPTVGTTTTFTNLGYSVITNNTSRVDIQNTQHTATIQSFTIDPSWLSKPEWGGAYGQAGTGLNGVFATNASDVLRVNNNTFSQNYYPVTANYTVAPNSGIIMSVATNTISTTNVDGVREGVTVNSAVSFTPTTDNMRIAANTFSNVVVGVKAMSVTNGLRISNNSIATATLTNFKPRGVHLANVSGNGAIVDNNTISSAFTATSAAAFSTDNIGIYCENSPNCKIKCNTITKVGNGVEYRYGNSSPGDGLFGNTFNYPIRRGLVLSNGGLLGVQGNSVSASANVWNGFVNITNVDQTYVGGFLPPVNNVSDAVNSPLWVRNITTGAIELPNDNAFAAPSLVGNIFGFAATTLSSSAPSYTPGCPTTLTVGLKMASGSNIVSYEDRDIDFENYIQNILPSSNANVTPQDKFMLKQFMFDELVQHPSANNTLINFVNQQQNTSVDAYHEIDSLLASGNVNAANAKNAQASQNNDITQTQNAYNDLFIAGINSKADLDNLSALADLCPAQYGTAVYQARALLHTITFVSKEYSDSCYTDKLTARMGYDEEKEKSISIADGVHAKLFPNPNNGNFTLVYDLKTNTEAIIQIIDITGKLVYTTSVDNLNTRTQINLNNLHSGMYFVQLLNSTNLLWTDKLIISK